MLMAGCASDNLTEYVNPMVGTDWNGHTYPGASVPFGLVSASPDTGVDGWAHCSGYRYQDPTIMGFSQTHFSGTGAPDMGDFLLVPVTGEPKFEVGSEDNPDEGYRSRFSHETEVANPGYYAVTLEDYGIRCEATATKRCTFYRFVFPSDQKSGIIIDLDHGIGDHKTDCLLEFTSDNTIKMMRRSSGFIGNHTYYSFAEFSEDIVGCEYSENRDKVYLEFPAGSTILVRMGVSTVGCDGAEKNLRVEIPHWEFEEVKDDANVMWNKELARIHVRKAVKEDDKTILYTALYHTMIAPIEITDVDGRHYGWDGKIHESNVARYTTFSLWDTYRALHPLYNIICRDKNIEFINSMLEFDKEFGGLPIHVFGIWEVYGMIGMHSTAVLADAIIQDVPGFDYEQAYDAMKREVTPSDIWYLRGLHPMNERGFIPVENEDQSVSKLMEYAFNYWCVARVADKLGKTEEAAKYYELAKAYKNVYDPDSGFVRGRHEDGSWVEPFDPYKTGNSYYTEGNAWQYNFYVPQDINTYIGMFGGDEAFASKLDEMFQTNLSDESCVTLDVTGLIGQYAQGNEPSHHAAYLYNFTGQPWKTQEMVARIKREMYTSAPDGLCGNEDYGQMSAWYIMSAIGFYPVTPASGFYVLGTPTFKEIALRLYNGKQFVVKAPNVSEENVYVQSVTLNGRPYTKTYISTNDVQKGGELVFNMGPKPNKEWGVAEQDRPHISIND